MVPFGELLAASEVPRSCRRRDRLSEVPDGSAAQGGGRRGSRQSLDPAESRRLRQVLGKDIDHRGFVALMA
jgi:hypothetical protein